MSLINQMLQDLDKRSSDGVAAHAMHSQIRVVPPSRRIHAIWWVAPILMSILAATAVVAWRSQQKALPPEIPLGVVDLLAPSLKLSPSLSMVQSLTQGAPALIAESASPEKPASIEKRASATPDVLPLSMSTQVEARVPEKMTKAIAPVVDVAPEKTLPMLPGGKQIKEVNSQQRAENEYRKAIQLQQQGKVADAIVVLEQTLLLDPLHTAARQTLVGLLIESKRQDEAMRRLKDGLGVDPAQPGMAMILARLQVDRGEARAAVETLQHSLPYASDRADYQAFLAALLQREGRNIEAAEYYSMALQKAPQNAIWWMGLGISLQAENRLQQAQEAFARAKASNTLSPELQAFVEQRLNQLLH